MIRSKSEAVRAIFRVNLKNGKSEFRARIGSFDGRDIRLGAAVKANLVRKIEDWYRQKGIVGESFVQLSRKDAMDAVLALSIIRGRMSSESLTSIVEAHFRASGEAVVQRPLTEVYAEYIKTCESDEQIKSVRSRVGRFVATCADKIACDVAADDILKYLDGLGACAPKTWNNNMLYIKTFCNWCAKKVRRYMATNPIADLEKRQVASKIPEYAKANTVAALFRAAETNDRHRDSVLFALSLSFFCGMRTAEIFRLDPADVRLDEGSVIVRKPKGYTKGISHRTFHIPEAAERWLRTVDFARVVADPISERVFEKTVKRLCQNVDGKVPKNAGRHTFITMHIAAYGEPQKTLGIVGTSESMRKKNYEGIGVTRAEGESYFAIRPQVS